MKKVLMLTTTAYMSERFNRSNILTLEEMGYEVHVAANFEKGNPTTAEVLEHFKQWIEEHHGKWHSIAVTKSPADVSNNYKAYRQVLGLIKENRYDFIHCHTPVGGVLGRLAAHRTHTKVIYTAHGFHFFGGAPVKNWILYYPVERFLSRWTDVLVVINQEDYRRAKKSFHAKKTEYVPGVGINLEKFRSDAAGRDEKRKHLGLRDGDIMLLSVGELNKNKNHEMMIRAAVGLEKRNIQYMIAGQGKLFDKLNRLISQLHAEDRVHLLGYQSDAAGLYGCADIFILPSFREGLSLSVMEAMASGLPVICRNIRGNNDLIENEKGGFLMEENKCRMFAESIERLAEHEDLRRSMGEYNREKVKNFGLPRVREQMVQIYEGL